MAATSTREFAALGVEPLAGQAREIGERLKAGEDGQIVAFRLEHAGKGVATAFAETVRLIAPMIFRKLADRETATLEKLIDALVPTVSPPEHMLTEARMNAEARMAVLHGAEWVSAARLSEIAGFSGQNASAQPNKWKREGKIFALRQDGSDLYPGYALDPNAQYRPLKGLAPVLKAFGNELDAWDIAIWFASTNSFLGGAVPKDLLIGAPERVLAAAEDEIAGVLHG
jgi:hypothetical protein